MVLPERVIVYGPFKVEIEMVEVNVPFPIPLRVAVPEAVAPVAVIVAVASTVKVVVVVAACAAAEIRTAILRTAGVRNIKLQFLLFNGGGIVMSHPSRLLTSKIVDFGSPFLKMMFG